MPEIDLRQPGFTYSVCGPFTKKGQEIHKLDKACFKFDMAHGDSKDLIRRTASGRILHNKASYVAKSPKHDRYETGLGSIVYKAFDEKNLLLRVEINF